MHTRIRTVVPAVGLPVDLDKATRHVRIDSDADADLFSIYVASATAIAEKYLGRALITQTLEWTVVRSLPPNGDSYGMWTPVYWASSPWLCHRGNRYVELPYGPLQTVNSVVSGRWDEGDTTLVAGTDYHLDATTDPARVHLTCERLPGDHLVVQFVAGYGDTVAAIPATIQHAIMIIAAGMYQNRGDDDAMIVSQGAYHLLDPFRSISLA